MSRLETASKSPEISNLASDAGVAMDKSRQWRDKILRRKRHAVGGVTGVLLTTGAAIEQYVGEAVDPKSMVIGAAGVLLAGLSYLGHRSDERTAEIMERSELVLRGAVEAIHPSSEPTE